MEVGGRFHGRSKFTSIYFHGSLKLPWKLVETSMEVDRKIVVGPAVKSLPSLLESSRLLSNMLLFCFCFYAPFFLVTYADKRLLCSLLCSFSVNMLALTFLFHG